HAVIGQSDMGAIGDKKLPCDIDAQFFQAVDFLEEGHRIEDDAVADDSAAVGPQHSAGDQLEHEFFPADDDGVPGIVAAGVPRYNGEASRENVYDLAFAFIAPLGAQNHGCLCSHLDSFPSISTAAHAKASGDPRHFDCVGLRLCGRGGTATNCVQEGRRLATNICSTRK